MASANVGEEQFPGLRLLPCGTAQADQSQPAFPPDFPIPDLEHPDELQEAFPLPNPFFGIPTLPFAVSSPQLVHPDERSVNDFEDY